MWGERQQKTRDRKSKRDNSMNRRNGISEREKVKMIFQGKNVAIDENIKFIHLDIFFRRFFYDDRIFSFFNVCFLDILLFYM